MQLLSSAMLLLGVTMAAEAPGFDECDVLYNASVKSLQTPHHVYSTKTLAGGARESPNEAIFVAGVEYVRIHGSWTRSPMVVQEMIEAAQEKLKTRPDVCMVAATETINGEAVTTYKVHNKVTNSDSQVRILRSSGLLQGQTLLLPDKSRMEVRYDYTNVHLPN